MAVRTDQGVQSAPSILVPLCAGTLFLCALATAGITGSTPCAGTMRSIRRASDVCLESSRVLCVGVFVIRRVAEERNGEGSKGSAASLSCLLRRSASLLTSSSLRSSHASSSRRWLDRHAAGAGPSDGCSCSCAGLRRRHRARRMHRSIRGRCILRCRRNAVAHTRHSPIAAFLPVPFPSVCCPAAVGPPILACLMAL